MFVCNFKWVDFFFSFFYLTCCKIDLFKKKIRGNIFKKISQPKIIFLWLTFFFIQKNFKKFRKTIFTQRFSLKQIENIFFCFFLCQQTESLKITSIVSSILISHTTTYLALKKNWILSKTCANCKTLINVGKERYQKKPK